MYDASGITMYRLYLELSLVNLIVVAYYILFGVDIRLVGCRDTLGLFGCSVPLCFAFQELKGPSPIALWGLLAPLARKIFFGTDIYARLASLQVILLFITPEYYSFYRKYYGVRSA